MWSAWWFCWSCLKAYHVPTTGRADTCDCGRTLVPLLAPTTASSRI